MKNILPISIVIPAKNEEVSIGKLFEDLKKQTYQPTEIILADARSTDRTREIAREYEVKVVDGGIPGVGRNRGAEAATQETILFLDADIEISDTEFLEHMHTKFVEKGAKFASGGYAPKADHNGWFNSIVCILFNTFERLSSLSFLYNTLAGACIMVNKHTLQKISGFDERLRYMEDKDLSVRFAKKRIKHYFIDEYVNVNFINNDKGHGDRNPMELKAVLFIPFSYFVGSLGVIMRQTKIFNRFGVKLGDISGKLYGSLGGVVNYENPNKPKDREAGYPKGTTKTQRRFYEIFQGLLFWIFLLLPVAFGLLGWDLAFVIYVAFLVSYWGVRSIKFALGIIIGYYRMVKEMEMDWMQKIKEENLEGALEDIRFIYLCPVYGEGMDILDPSFESFANSRVGAKKIDVVMAIEEKKSEMQIENFKKLEKKYGHRFGSMQYYIHPAGIPGEVAGVKGANINWATRHFVKDLEKEGKDISKYLLVTCDSDQRIHEKYLSAIAYKYLTVEEPNMRFYATAVHTFENNIWRVPTLIRAQSNMLTLGLMYGWVMDKTKHIPFTNEEVYVRDSFSSYVVNLKTLHDFEYWDPEIANDDTAFYWNAMVRSKGHFKSEEVYLPTYNDAVENESAVKSYKSFYKQQHRWGWGAINVPITMAAMVRDKEGFHWYRRLTMFNMLVEYQIWYLTVIIIFTFGLRIMNLLSPTFQFSAYASNLPNLLGLIFGLMTLLNIPLIYYRRQIIKVPKDWPLWRHIWDIIETFLITVNMLTFAFIPFLQAKTEILLGKAEGMRNFYVTDKVEIKKES